MPAANIACGPIYIGLRITIGTYVGILWQYIVRVCAKLRHKQQGAYSGVRLSFYTYYISPIEIGLL